MCPLVCPPVNPSMCPSIYPSVFTCVYPSDRLSAYVQPYVPLCVPQYVPRYAPPCMFLRKPLHTFPLPSDHFIYLSICPPYVSRVSMRAGAAGVVFRPNLSISLMQFDLGGKHTVGVAAVGGSFQPDPSTCLSIPTFFFACFIDPAKKYALEASMV